MANLKGRHLVANTTLAATNTAVYPSGLVGLLINLANRGAGAGVTVAIVFSTAFKIARIVVTKPTNGAAADTLDMLRGAAPLTNQYAGNPGAGLVAASTTLVPAQCDFAVGDTLNLTRAAWATNDSWRVFIMGFRG
jgi:hypothetical protein